MPIQLFFGHLNGEYVVHHQPPKMAAIEARWRDEKPASEVLLAWPDVENRRNLFAITLPPPWGSIIDSDSPTAGEVGLDSIPPENWPPVIIPFFAFRIMVGCGLLMLLLAWVGSYLSVKGHIEQNRLLLRARCPLGWRLGGSDSAGSVAGVAELEHFLQQYHAKAMRAQVLPRV